MPDPPVLLRGIPSHHHPDLEVRLGVVEHAVSRTESDLTHMADEMAVLRTSIERLGDRLTAAIDGLRNSTTGSIEALRASTEAALREQRAWGRSAFRWQLGITIAIGGALFAMIAHGLKWF